MKHQSKWEKYTETEQVNLSEVLKRVTIGTTQAAGYVQMIPLLFKKGFADMKHPVDLFIKAADMGVLEVENPSAKWAIIPAHTAFITGSGMQDQAMTTTGIIPPKETKKYDNAVCVQEQQTGLIPREQYVPNYLPFEVREVAFSTRHVIDFTKLFDRLSAINYRNRLGKIGRLRYYFRHHAHELNRFVAEFEPVPHQVGAVMLIDGVVVGVEIAPSSDFWLKNWRALIRESYGSLAIEYQQFMEYRPTEPAHKIPFGMQGLETIEDIEKEMTVVNELEKTEAEDIVKALRKEALFHFEDEATGPYKVVSLFNYNYLGQRVEQNGKTVFLSLCKRYAKVYEELMKQVVYMEDRTCLICGYNQLNIPPHWNGAPSYERCPCCGTRFGHHDFLESMDKLRKNWLEQAALWAVPEKMPANWQKADIIRQFRNIDNTDVKFEALLKEINGMKSSQNISSKRHTGTHNYWTGLVNTHFRLKPRKKRGKK